MSSEPTYSTHDLRSTAQDYKRAANRKHKWAFGTVERVGRGVGNPRPGRASETEYNQKRRETKCAVASLAHGARMARKHDVLEGTDTSATEDSSGGSGSDFDDHGATSPAPDAGVMYSFDATRAPSHGSQILNAAMAKAVERFEEKETQKLVSAEYDVLDSEGEVVGLTPVKKSKGKAKAKEEKAVVPDADEDYEFV